MPIVSVSMDESILRNLDDVAQRRRYRSRSEAVLESLREFIDVTEWGREGGEASVILAVIYEKGNPRADLAMLQHRFDEIRTMLHTHVDDAAEGAHRANPPNQGNQGDQVHPDRGPPVSLAPTRDKASAVLGRRGVCGRV